MEEIMKKRQKEADDAYEAQWDSGRGSHHPDYDPYARGDDVVKASRETEELYNAIVKNDIKKVYKKIEEGADVNFAFGRAYRSPECYTPLMVAAHRCETVRVSPPLAGVEKWCTGGRFLERLIDVNDRHRGRYECCRALLRAGADPNYMNKAGDLVLFWAIDGGIEIIKLMHEYGADMDARTPKDWTPLSYCKAKGKYGATEEKGIYPEDVLLYYGASEYGKGPIALGVRSPRQSFNPMDENFLRERGSYQTPMEHP